MTNSTSVKTEGANDFAPPTTQPLKPKRGAHQRPYKYQMRFADNIFAVLDDAGISTHARQTLIAALCNFASATNMTVNPLAPTREAIYAMMDAELMLRRRQLSDAAQSARVQLQSILWNHRSGILELTVRKEDESAEDEPAVSDDAWPEIVEW